MIGGAAIVGATVDAGLVDELRLIVYPLIRGGGQGVVLVVGTARDGAAQMRAVDGRPVEPGVRTRAVTEFDRGVVAEFRANGGWGFEALVVCSKHVPVFIGSKRDVEVAEDMLRAHG